MKHKKLLSLLLSMTMALGLSAPALAAGEDVAATDVAGYEVPADVAGKLVILHTNDTHGHDVAVEGGTIGTAGVAALKKDFEAAGATVLLFSAGDFSQGTTLVSLDKGASAVGFMNAAGYDAATLGNHEFDYKLDALKANIAAAEFPILAANIVDKTTGKPVFGDHTSFDTPIGKVGVFGLDTPETMTKAHPDNVKGLTFYQGQELVDCAQAQVDALKAEGCVYIVALSHLGVDPESAPNRSTDIFAQVKGVDLVLDGHSHTVMSGDSAVTLGETTLVSTGEYLNNVGVVILSAGKLESAGLVNAAAYTKQDPEAATVVNGRNDVVSAELDKVFATTEVVLDGNRAPGVRTQETNLGDFATDAILWSAKQAVGEDKVDLALTNGGGIRATIEAGDITMNTMKTVFPFGNEVALVDLTGAELLEALEAATYSLPTAIGAFPQVSGVTYTVNVGVAYEKGEAYPDSTYFAPAAPGSRVTIHTVANEAWDANKIYTMATNDFTAAGGDSYGVLVGKSIHKTGVALEDALVSYTREVLGNVITAEQYGQSAGRITFTNRPADLSEKAWYYNAAAYALDNGILKGTNKGFEGEAKITVATVYQTLYNMSGEQTAEGGKTVALPENAWYAEAITWAANAGLYDGDSFMSDSVITRSNMASILAAYGEKEQLPFTADEAATKAAPDAADIPEADLAGMAYCVGAGILKGNERGELLPNGDLTRGQWAQVLMNWDLQQTAGK